MFYVILFQINNFIQTSFSENKTFLNKWLLNTWSYFALSCGGNKTFLLQIVIVLLKRWKPEMTSFFFYIFLWWTIRQRIFILCSNFFLRRWIIRHEYLFLSFYLIIVNEFDIFGFLSNVKIFLWIYCRCNIRFILH